MVLHNDKWARKAKRASERRKGTGKARNASSQTSQKLDHLELSRPQAQSDDEEAETTSSRSDSDESFEFDSGDEGKTEQERAQLSRIPKLPDAKILHQNTVTARIVDKNAVGTDSNAVEVAPTKPCMKYARRRLVDNSIRYEEGALDPYISVPEPEPDYAYHTMTTKEFHDPSSVELVPDERKTTHRLLPMEDTAHFDQMKTMQQKEEYARNLRSRFGQRLSKTHDLQGLNEKGDDDFFREVISQKPMEASMSSNARTAVGTADLKSTKEHEPLEQFLDDLLRI